MAQIVREADIEAAACHHQKGETDDDTPDNDVYQGFDAAAAWVRELLFHHDTKIRILGGYWKYPLPAKQISVRRLRKRFQVADMYPKLADVYPKAWDRDYP